jgi:hypothetical protein
MTLVVRGRAIAPYNKRLERMVIRRRVRTASAPLHHALAARRTAQSAAAQLRRCAAAIASIASVR